MKTQCKICGKSFYNITASHLKLHGITRKEYMDMFGKEGLSNTTYSHKEVNEIDKYAKQRAISHCSIQAKETKRMGLIKRAI